MRYMSRHNTGANFYSQRYVAILKDIVIDADGGTFQLAIATRSNQSPISVLVTKLMDANAVKTACHEASMSELRELAGYRIKVTRKSAKPMVGKLVSSVGGTVKLEQRRYGGSVVFPIENNDIKKLEVFY